MTADRWRKVEELYHAVQKCDLRGRAEFLAVACRDDDELKREVESLLAQAPDGNILDGPLIDLLPESTSAQSLSAGDKLGPFEIISRLGEGGMGQVWKASDTRLNRFVAIKTSHKHFSQRFAREAKAIAALNHPHICALYDVGPDYLVMEYIEGSPIKGPLPVQEALQLAVQIAEALDAAHRRGIVHRDLKPANIMLTKSGVKLLDFGLAKMHTPTIGEETLTKDLTGEGQILGTLPYMSPEQVQGREADARSDIFSFGLVLYEMITGKRAFTGASPASIVAAILEREAPSLAPEGLDRVVRACLAKDPAERFQSVRDLKRAIEWGVSGALLESPRKPGRVARPWLLWAMTAALAVGMAFAGAGWWNEMRPVDLPLTRLSVDLGPDAITGPNLTAAMSPDGRRLVFVARAANGKHQLATRLLDQSQTTLLPGTEGGHLPFFAPDSQSVGFFADRKLKKISLQSGVPVTLCDAPFSLGGSWGPDGTIIAAINLQSGLSKVSAGGGSPQPFTKLGKGEVTHRWPQILPGGKAILFTASPTNIGMENARIDAISLLSGVTRTIVARGYFGRYLPANASRGYLLYLDGQVLMGVAFDPNRLEIQGTPTPLLEDASVTPYLDGGGQFDFSGAPSGHGTLVYLAGKVATPAWPVVWLDSSGKMQPMTVTPGYYSQPRFSPDGRRLALTLRTSSGTDIYVHELGRETLTRITFAGHAQGPVWTPDAKHIVFQWSASGFGIGWVRSDGSGEPRRILQTQNVTTPYSFSPDGSRLAYYENNPGTGFDISTLPLNTEDPDNPNPGKPELFLGTSADELAPMFSPDGRWLAYRSNESGIYEIYVRPFPGGRAGKCQVSTGFGLYGLWSNNGREIFYENAEENRIMAVEYSVKGDSFVPGKPRLWSEKQIFMPGNTNLALAPDGKRFAVFPRPEKAEIEKGTVHITFLQNFLDELRRRIPAGR